MNLYKPDNIEKCPCIELRQQLKGRDTRVPAGELCTVSREEIVRGKAEWDLDFKLRSSRVPTRARGGNSYIITRATHAGIRAGFNRDLELSLACELYVSMQLHRPCWDVLVYLFIPSNYLHRPCWDVFRFICLFILHDSV